MTSTVGNEKTDNKIVERSDEPIHSADERLSRANNEYLQ